MAGTGGKRRFVLFGAIGLLIAIAIATALNQPGGPMGEVKGRIESSRYLPQQHGPAIQLAAVRLPNGSLVQATVLSSIATKPGDVATMRIYRRVITGSEKYEVIDTGGSP